MARANNKKLSQPKVTKRITRPSSPAPELPEVKKVQPKEIRYEQRVKGEVISNDAYIHLDRDLRVDTKEVKIHLGEKYWVFGEHGDMYIVGGTKYVPKSQMIIIG